MSTGEQVLLILISLLTTIWTINTCQKCVNCVNNDEQSIKTEQRLTIEELNSIVLYEMDMPKWTPPDQRQAIEFGRGIIYLKRIQEQSLTEEEKKLVGLSQQLLVKIKDKAGIKKEITVPNKVLVEIDITTEDGLIGAIINLGERETGMLQLPLGDGLEVYLKKSKVDGVNWLEKNFSGWGQAAPLWCTYKKVFEAFGLEENTPPGEKACIILQTLIDQL